MFNGSDDGSEEECPCCAVRKALDAGRSVERVLEDYDDEELQTVYVRAAGPNADERVVQFFHDRWDRYDLSWQHGSPYAVPRADCPNPDLLAPLLQAIFFDNLHIVDMCLDDGHDLDFAYSDEYGMDTTPLYFVLWNSTNDERPRDPLTPSQRTIAHMLLDCSPDAWSQANKARWGGATVLMRAAHRNEADIVKRLLDLFAGMPEIVFAKDAEGRDAMWYAVDGAVDNDDALRALLGHARERPMRWNASMAARRAEEIAAGRALETLRDVAARRIQKAWRELVEKRRVYEPGGPIFERLKQRWIDRGMMIR